jgi:ribosomal protein L35AE/L33A
MKGKRVRLLGVAGALLVCLAALVGSAAADDAQKLSISDVSVNEPAGTAEFTISLTAGTDTDADVDWATSNGPAPAAVAGSDYTSSSGTETVPAGGSVTVTVPVANDSLDEFDEHFTVTLSDPVRATIDDATATGTITDDDLPPTTTTVGDVTVTEGNSGTVDANFNVGLSGPSGKPITIRYSTFDGTAMQPSDYTAKINQDITINPGGTSGTIAIAVNGDTAPEPNETFSIGISSAPGGGNVTIGADTQGTGTITNDDSQPTVTIGDPAPVTEGDVTVSFPVTLSGPAPAPVAITWTTTDGSAAAPGDYDAASSTLNIATGGTGGTIQVAVNEDELPEGTETFHVDLQTASGATLQADRRGTATISDDDSAPTVTIGDPAPVTESDVNVSFPVTLSGPAPAPVTISWTTTDGSAVAPGDYDAANGPNLVIPAGSSSGTIQVGVNEDALPESNETFHVDLQTATGATLQADRRGTATITDDDSTPSASINDVTVTEGNSGTVNATFTVTLSSAAASSVQIRYSTVNNSASAPSDFTAAVNQTVTIAQGATSANFNISVNGDTVPEGSGSPPAETFFVDLTSVVSGPATISSDSRGTGTINDDDSAPTASINDATVTEGNAGTVNATFTVTLSAAAATPVQIRYSTVNNSAVGTPASPADFTSATNATVTIAQGSTTGTFNISVNGDTIPEGSGNPRVEVFFVDLVGVTGPAVIGSDFRGIGTITDDDTLPTVTAISDPTVIEGNDGQVDANFEVTLSGNAQSTVQIGYATADGSASAGSDYAAQSGTLTIPVGQSKGTITVKVNGDVFPEGNENFHVDLTSATLAQFGDDRRGTATIENDDAARTLTVAGGEVTEGTGATVNLEYKLRLSGTTSQEVRVTATTSDGSASAGAGDYQVKSQVITWAPNTPADQLEKTFTVVVNGDALDEGDETVIVTLSAPQNAVITGATAAGTIKDNDNRSLLGVGNAEANEGTGGSKSTMTFKVTLSPASARAVSVHYATANGTATAGPDYEAKEGDLSFAPGETEKTIDVVILGDDVNEENETVLVNLSNVAGAGLAGGGGLGSGTIVDRNAPPSLSIDDVVTREGEGASFTVTLAGNTLRTVSVGFGTGSGSAREGADFLPRSGTLTFAPGEKTKAISVTVFDDADAEPNETFTVGLGNPVNGTITKATGTATIELSDQAGVANTGPGPLGPPIPTGPLAKPKTAPKTQVFPRLVLGPRTATMRKGIVRMTVNCTKASKLACAGRILLLTTTKPAIALGQKKFNVKKGKKAFVSIKVAKDVRALIAELRTIKVKVVVYVNSSTKKNVRVDPGTINVRMPTGTNASSRP